MNAGLLEEYQARMRLPSDMQHYMPVLFATVLRYPKAQVVELGTRKANSTSALLAAAGLVGGCVWSVDIAQTGAPSWWAQTGLWEFTQADDMDETVAPRPCDVLFIDTSHTYAHTLAELRKFAPCVRPGGTILCHDTLQFWGGDEVWRALNDYCAETGLSWRETGFGEQGLGQIEIPR